LKEVSLFGQPGIFIIVRRYTTEKKENLYKTIT